MMAKGYWLVPVAFLLFSKCQGTGDVLNDRKNQAELLFRNIYGGEPSKISNLVTEDVVSTYPIFKQVLGTSVIHGREAYENFAVHFKNRWKEPHLSIDDAVAEENQVVLIWSFHAKSAETTPDSSFISGQDYQWGGITLFKFNSEGKIWAEIGEESAPGPFARLESEDLAE